MESIAKVFQNGRSQAVRLPKAFRFKGNEVRIRKKGDMVILEPLGRSRWPEGYVIDDSESFLILASIRGEK